MAVVFTERACCCLMPLCSGGGLRFDSHAEHVFLSLGFDECMHISQRDSVQF